MSDIEQSYTNACNTGSDIYEHLPTLESYARECTAIAELGVGGVVSTWALLSGLLNNNAPVKSLVCVDIIEPPHMHLVKKTAHASGISLQFILHDSATVDLPEPVDMLFIDSWHIYGHLKRELQKHHANVRKYIVMHDTEIDKDQGESIRSGSDIHAQVASSGYLYSEIACGLQSAIDEFLLAQPEWKLHAVYSNCNGLTILKRM